MAALDELDARRRISSQDGRRLLAATPWGVWFWEDAEQDDADQEDDDPAEQDEPDEDRFAVRP